MKFFLTGGSGFLGRNLIRYALDKDDDLSIIVLSRSEESDEIMLKAAGNEKHRVQILRGNIEDEQVLIKGVSEVQVVIHMAAKVRPWGVFSEFEVINIGGTRKLVTVIEQSANKPRLVYISSFTALVSNHHDKDNIPNWAPYSKSKALSEDIVLNSSISDKVLLRLGWLWGKDDNVLLPKLVSLSKNPLWKICPRSYPVSIQHVTNACEAVYLVAKNPSLPSQLYEFKDPDGDIDVEDFLESYVKAASQRSDNVPRPFENFRAPKWLVWGFITFVECIPFLNYGKKWALEGMTREPLMLLFNDYRLNDAKARKEIGYVGHVRRAEGLDEVAEMRG
ncbi:7474_t:CDS:2 [Paraglomus occultum]|uniref:7474_t:CDS:1 n=1 Tax=Paraglomus occultum TaxID=144539 RepID=A0A9N8VSP0_9GLOM|nr:7474_t:CDS:2 [Paraglomus occultum]